MQVTSIDKDFTTFLVTSENNVYKVQQNIITCYCKMTCSHCDACIHKFHCECFDNTIKWNMCKHVHAVCKFIAQNVDATNFITNEIVCNEIPAEDLEKRNAITSEIRRHKRRKKVTTKDLKLSLFKIIKQIKTERGRELLKKCLEEADKKIKILENPARISIKKYRISLKQIVKQCNCRLFSTKKKCTGSTHPKKFNEKELSDNFLSSITSF